MQRTANNNIEEVVKHRLCLCCGACMGVCPQNAIIMTETAGGLLLPEVNNEICNSCGLCLKVCPGSHLEKGLLPPQMDPFKGNVISAYCGQACDAELLQNGQSGGVVTALLGHLLKSGRINSAVVTQMSDGGAMRPDCMVTSDPKVIRKSQGSKYCPVPVAAVAQKALAQTGEKTAIVGLGCHFHGLTNAQVHLGGPSPIRIGLVCDRMLAYGAIDYLIGKSGVSREEAAFFQFRSKKFNGWPGDCYIKTKDCREFCVENKYRMEIKNIFTPPRCRLCFDKMNVLCDLVVSDAWGIRKDRLGYSAIITRTEKGQDAMLSAQQAGMIKIENVDAEAVFKGQAIEKKRIDWTAFTDVWQNSEISTPAFHFDKRWYGNTKGVSWRTYQNKTRLSLRMTTVKSRDEGINAAKRQVRLDKMRFYLSFRGLDRCIRKIMRPLEQAVKRGRPASTK